MPHSKTSAKTTARRNRKPGRNLVAETAAGTSRSKGREIRKREFVKELKVNLDNEDPDRADQLVGEFRALILGR